jgi:hypothetical protein
MEIVLFILLLKLNYKGIYFVKKLNYVLLKNLNKYIHSVYNFCLN